MKGNRRFKPTRLAAPVVDVARAGAARQPPADDPLGMDADQRRRQRHRLTAPAALDPPGMPGMGARQVIDHDRRAATARDVAELLRQLELVAADVDRVMRGVVDPRHRHHVRRPVTPDRGDPPELTPAGHVRELGLREHAHQGGRGRGYSVVTARSTSTLEARRAGGIEATTPAIAARMKNVISDPTGSTNTKPSSASGRETISENTMPRTVPRIAPMPAVMTDSIVTIRRTCQRDMPTARSLPSSRVRSCTDSASVLTMPSRATIADRASSAKTSPSSWLTASACLSLNWSIVRASVCGNAISAASACLASLSVSTPGSPAAITNARF